MFEWLAERLKEWRVYWTAVGVIPRYQLVIAYFLVIFAFVFASWTNHDAATKAAQAVVAVQQQRAESIYTQCAQQNARHDAVVGAINQQIIIAVAQGRESRKFLHSSSNPKRIKQLAKRAETIKDPGAAHARLADMAAEVKSYLPKKYQRLFDQSYAQTFALLNAGAPHQNCSKRAHQAAPPIRVPGLTS